MGGWALSSRTGGMAYHFPPKYSVMKGKFSYRSCQCHEMHASGHSSPVDDFQNCRSECESETRGELLIAHVHSRTRFMKTAPSVPLLLSALGNAVLTVLVSSSVLVQFPGLNMSLKSGCSSCSSGSSLKLLSRNVKLVGL